MEKNKKFSCDWCGKDCRNPPALQLHQNFCKSRPDLVIKEVAKGEKCNHSFRLLNPNIQSEKLALVDGYIQVCNKCLQLD